MYNVCVLKSVPNFDQSGLFELVANNKKATPFKVEKVSEGIQLTMFLPEKEIDPADILTETKLKEICADLLSAFSNRIIDALKRRQAACKAKLFKNLGTAYTDSNHMQIFYKEGNRLCSFNLPSYEAMSDCIKALQFSEYHAIFREPAWIDQIIKALLNDPEQNHEDAGGFKYSELVSMLCAAHMYHAQR